MNFTRQSTQII